MTSLSNHDEAPLRLLLAARSSRKPRKDGDGPGPEQGLGIETQDERAREWAEREGHVIVDVAADVRSGSVPPWDRPNLRPWVACGCDWCKNQDGKRGVPDKKRVYDSSRITRFDGILAFKVDRLSRGDDQDFAFIEGWASHHGKKLVIVDGPQFPSRGDSDYWQWAAQRREAFKELENIKERAARGRKKLTENKAMIGKPPFGLEVTGAKYHKTIAPTDQGRELVPEAFDRVISGESMGRVARWLTEQTGRRFNRKSIRDLVYCATYVGERRNAEGRTVLTCEPLLVTPDGKPDWGRFRAAQKMLSTHPRQGPRASDALLSGLLRCAGCGAKMFRHTTTTAGKKYLYYVCDSAACRAAVRLDFAEAAVDAIITKTQDRPVVDYRLVPGDDHEAEKQAVREQMAQLPLLELPDAEFDARMAELRAERDRVNALDPVAASYDEVETGEGTYAEVWARLDTEGRSAFLARRHFRVYATKQFVRLERGEGEWTWRAYYDRQLGVMDDVDWLPEDAREDGAEPA
jgi:DNA invertase Pin-like site-specific DNA recombinase